MKLLDWTLTHGVFNMLCTGDFFSFHLQDCLKLDLQKRIAAILEEITTVSVSCDYMKSLICLEDNNFTVPLLALLCLVFIHYLENYHTKM